MVRWLKLLGPAFAVSIGYVDPGNWASDLAAGAYRYALLWVIVAANVIAIVMQLAVTRITIETREDFATLVARRWPRLAPAFWCAFQAAVVATDLAEFTGIVLGAQMLFGLSLLASVTFGIVVLAILLVATGRTIRLFELTMLGALVLMSFAYVDIVSVLHPDMAEIAQATVTPRIPDAAALVVIVAIIGATVMPHNLFLHSWLVKRRCAQEPARGLERFYFTEVFVALNIAAIVNGAILIVGASIHGGAGSIQDAFIALGSRGVVHLSQLFGAALLVSGIAASTTATVAGDAVVSAFSPVRIPAALRRAAVIVPAAGLLLAHIDATALLLWSQTALCLILPVALVPLAILLYETSVRETRLPAVRSLCSLTVLATVLCIGVDAVLLVETF